MTVAIVDYGMGNLFSIRQACTNVGLQASITASSEEIRLAEAVILPGIGAFGDAMASLRDTGLVETLHDVVRLDTPLVGICLGMQLLMTESHEFGRHAGLGIVPGVVRRLPNATGWRGRLKVPQVGWNHVHAVPDEQEWAGSLLEGLPSGTLFYFVHSYYVQPDDPAVIRGMTTYGDFEFCSMLAHRNVFGCQAHPERSGPDGLRVYRNLAALVARHRGRNEAAQKSVVVSIPEER